MVSFFSPVVKELEGRPRFNEIFQEDKYPAEFSYKGPIKELFRMWLRSAREVSQVALL